MKCGRQAPAISQLVGALENEAMRCKGWHVHCAPPCSWVVLMAAGDTASCQQLVHSTLKASPWGHLQTNVQESRRHPMQKHIGQGAGSFIP